MYTPVGIAVRRTDSADEPSVGIPDVSDSREDSEARASDIEAASEGELPESVGALPKSVVAAARGIESPSAKVARLRRRILLRNIATDIDFGFEFQ